MIGFVFLFCLFFRWGVLHRLLLVVGWCWVLYSSGFLLWVFTIWYSLGLVLWSRVLENVLPLQRLRVWSLLCIGLGLWHLRSDSNPNRKRCSSWYCFQRLVLTAGREPTAGAKGGSRETRKKAIVENQAKEDSSWNQGGSSVMAHFGSPSAWAQCLWGLWVETWGAGTWDQGQAGMKGLWSPRVYIL